MRLTNEVSFNVLNVILWRFLYILWAICAEVGSYRVRLLDAANLTAFQIDATRITKTKFNNSTETIGGSGRLGKSVESENAPGSARASFLEATGATEASFNYSLRNLTDGLLGSAAPENVIAFVAGFTFGAIDFANGSLEGPVEDMATLYNLLKERRVPDENMMFISDIGLNFGTLKSMPLEFKVEWKASSYLRRLKTQIQKLRHGKNIFIFYHSGHGDHREDLNDDELDGFDEVVLMPGPRQEAVYDDDVYEALLEVPKGVEVVMIVDACHSEGFSDLPYNYIGGGKWCTDWRRVRREPQANFVYLSASQNHQTAADYRTGGALSKHLMTVWNTHEKFDTGMKALRRVLGRYDQHPNSCACPRFNHKSKFLPFDVQQTLKRIGTSKTSMPDICAGGGRDPRLVKEARANFQKAGFQFEVVKEVTVKEVTINQFDAKMLEGVTFKGLRVKRAPEDGSTPLKKGDILFMFNRYQLREESIESLKNQHTPFTLVVKRAGVPGSVATAAASVKMDPPKHHDPAAVGAFTRPPGLPALEEQLHVVDEHFTSDMLQGVVLNGLTVTKVPDDSQVTHHKRSDLEVGDVLYKFNDFLLREDHIDSLRRQSTDFRLTVKRMKPVTSQQASTNAPY